MFRVLILTITLLMDGAILALALNALFGEEIGPGSLLFGGMSLIFGTFVAALLDQRRSKPWPRLVEAARHLCWLLPVIAFIGSLDSGIVSGHEVLSIIGVATVGGINWVALTQREMKHA